MEPKSLATGCRTRLRSESLDRLRARALTATSTLDPDMEMVAISGRSVNPLGSKSPAAIGSANEL